jgi:hypothetical protein
VGGVCWARGGGESRGVRQERWKGGRGGDVAVSPGRVVHHRLLVGWPSRAQTRYQQPATQLQQNTARSKCMPGQVCAVGLPASLCVCAHAASG